MDSESIANFCSITDATDSTAEYFLSAAGGDLDMAIGLFYESGGSSAVGGASNPNIHEISAQMSDRTASHLAPVPTAAARHQTIILNDDDDSDAELEGGSERVLIGSSRIEEEDEQQQQQEEGGRGGSTSGSGSEPEDPVFTSNAGTTTTTARRLADLFRPPHGIMFTGTFEAARRFAREQGRWLLLTVHAPVDFASQAMNRDLWNSPLLQSFIRANFVFVQLIVGGSEERRYKSFYPFDDLYPHVALIDPRTGERVETLLVASIPVPGFKLVPTDRDMLELLGEFIAEHPPMDLIGDQRKRSSPRLEESSSSESPEMISNEPESKKCALVVPSDSVPSAAVPSVVVPVAVPMYDGPDAIQVQFRLPSGQKHRHRFSPHATLPQIFQTAAAVAKLAPDEFKLRTAEGELDEEAPVAALHNTMLTIIK